jgi:tetratricopeptide (TPR) repeat protein
LLALKAIAAAHLRDFATAEELLSRAEAIATDAPWVRLQRADLCEQQDRVEEALEFARAACAVHPTPFYRPGIQTCARLLQLLDRDDEAIQLLREADAVLQSGPVAGQLYALLSENGRWLEAEAALARFVELSPLLEPPARQWLSAQRGRIAYHLGRRAEAARLVREVDDDFHRQFAARLEAPAVQPERLQLQVTFVRQHFKTCAPATLAALGRYWQMPAEHLQLVETLCYDGTPAWEQRQWAEQNGWHVREFRVTHDSALALIERGIPFALSVVEATSAHMMAVIGFDRARGTLLLRDPGQPYVVEAAAVEFLKRYRPFGPRGMVFLPVQEGGRLEGVELPDVAVYDGYHQFRLALARHDRARAAEWLRQMETTASDHALVWQTRHDLATYDENTPEQARCLDQLLGRFPGNAARLLQRLACLCDAPREERIRFLQPACAGDEVDPALRVELARALAGDGRRLPEARQQIRRAARRRPLDAQVVGVQADLHWAEGRFDEATELYRFAANLEGFREELYQSWFVACRRTRRTDEAMAHLQDRFARFGRRSEQPALTLAWAWRELEQPARARAVLQEAARLRPDDGLLRLRSASLLASLGQNQEADRLLEAARGKVRENDWLRAAAALAELRLDTAAALRWAREILRVEPLALDAHCGVARALARLEGMASAQAHLKAACERFPQHYGLQRTLVEWLREGDPAQQEEAIRALLRVAPSDAWARRELAIVLTNSGRPEEALREAREGARIEPRNTISFSVLGYAYRGAHQFDEARAHFRRAVELSVDNADAVQALLHLARTDAERREELAFVERQLIEQVVTGDGLLAFLELARPVLEAPALLRSLQQAHRERPDLWHVWSALVSQLGHLGQLGDARDVAREATKRFPHLPRAWLDLAAVYRWRAEPEEEIAAAQRAFDLSPGWSQSAMALADALERRGKLHNARRIYERALHHAGQDAQLHALQAHLLWRLRQKDAAFAAVERALRLAPDCEWAWRLLDTWSHECGEPERTPNLARALTGARPGEARVWLTLARALVEPADLPERLAAVERALALDKRLTEAWDLKAEVLAVAERFDEAIRACQDGAAAGTHAVYLLRGLHAWIEARRRQLPEAIRLMRAVLAENASYDWGWNLLAQWLAEQEALPEAATALEHLLRLRPHDAWPQRQLGFLRLRQDDLAGARTAFAAALRLEPTDVAAAQNLLDLQLRADDLAGAADTLRVMQTHQPGAATLAAEVMLRLREGGDRVPLKALTSLCASPDPDPWPVEAAASAMQRAGQSPDALRIFEEAIRSETCNPQVAAAAIRLLLAARSTLAAARLFLRLEPGELRDRAAAPLVHGLGERKRRLLLRWLLWRRRDALAANDAAWGQVGYALSNCGRMHEAAAWMADWRSRREIQPWMLFNLCLALRHLGQYAEANDVARHVLSTWGHREGAADLRLFLAVEEALAGSVAAAQEHLAQVVVRENVAYDQDLRALATALVDFLKAPVGERAAQFRAVCPPLAQRFTTRRMLKLRKDVRRTFRRAGQVCVREGGGWRAQWWFGWKLHWPWLLVPLAWVALLVWLWARRRES